MTPQRNRPTFGLLADSVGHDYEVRLIAGVTDAVRRHNVNLVCYTSGAGGQLPGVRFGKLCDLLEHVVNPEAYDGLILTNTLLVWLPLAHDLSHFGNRCTTGPAT